MYVQIETQMSGVLIAVVVIVIVVIIVVVFLLMKKKNSRDCYGEWLGTWRDVGAENASILIEPDSSAGDCGVRLSVTFPGDNRSNSVYGNINGKKLVILDFYEGGKEKRDATVTLRDSTHIDTPDGGQWDKVLI